MYPTFWWFKDISQSSTVLPRIDTGRISRRWRVGTDWRSIGKADVSIHLVNGDSASTSVGFGSPYQARQKLLSSMTKRLQFQKAYSIISLFLAGEA